MDLWKYKTTSSLSSVIYHLVHQFCWDSYMSCIVRKHTFWGVGEGWSGGAKVTCILRHRCVQLILAYSLARPAVLVAGKGRGGIFLFLCLFTFILVPLSSLFFSFISSTLFYTFSPFLWDDTKWPTRVDVSLNTNTYITYHLTVPNKDSNQPVYLCSLISLHCLHEAVLHPWLSRHNFDPFKPNFYIVKLGFSEVYIIFLILLKT